MKKVDNALSNSHQFPDVSLMSSSKSALNLTMPFTRTNLTSVAPSLAARSIPDHIYPNQTYHSPTPYYSTTTTTPSTDIPALPPGEPMSINATKTRCGPLTQAERDHCRANNLCLYCRGNHFINVCPNMSNAAKKHFVSAAHSSGQA